MFKRKQDVDKHVNAVLSRKKDDKERNLQGFQIAKLYFDIKEYATAKKYLSAFFRARDDVPQAHQLMGDINVALGKKDEAIDNYKKALSLSGDFVASNRSLVKKICDLYCESNADVQVLKFWLDKCETLCPKDDVIFKLKVKISESVSGHDGSNIGTKENIIASELVNQPTNLALRIKLLSIYLESGKYEEAYENAVKTDLTTAFMDQLQWFETLIIVFQEYGSKNADTQSDSNFNQHLLHILRNLTYLSLWKKDISECVNVLTRFDKQLKKSSNLTNQDESWIAMLKEMKGQLFFLSALLLLKKAQNGLLKWQEANHLAGACFLASRSVGPLDAQAPWFVTAPQELSKFYNWWHLQSYDRLSQVGHMLLRLSQGELVDWTRTIKQQDMTALGHQKVFKAVFSPRDLKEQGEVSFFYKAPELSDSADIKEPLTERHMLDVDRVAYQVHLNDLSHLVWLCLQRYSPDKDAQPNYHFNILENIQYSVKNLENGGAETLCQLDILVFLLATVKCAASSMTENKYLYDDHSGQPSLLPVCLSKPLCTQDQNDWWTAAYKFCTNTVKEDFSKLRRVLIRGIETVRLIGSHGVSISMTAHIARSLDAKVASLKKAEFGCRCPASELSALESRAAYYWQKVKQMLEKLQRNQYSPVPKNRLFKEVGDGDADLPPRLIDKLTAEATFALALAAMNNRQYEEALEGFATHRSPWAKYHSAQIFKILADQEDQNDSTEECSPKRQALLLKARDCLYDVMDRLSGDKSHPLNVLVSRDLDDIEAHIHGLEYEDKDISSSGSFHTPSKYPAEIRSTPGAKGLVHSTPRNTIPSLFAENGVESGKGLAEPSYGKRDFNVSSTSDHYDRPRPSPERLDSQIRSLSYSQTSLFKMVLDRNEELIMINGKMMEELRDNNVQLKSVLTENKALMEELKNFLVENRDMMKEIKADFNAMKASMSVSAAAIPPAPPLFMPQIPTAASARGPFPGFPGPAYSGYMINSPVPQQPPLGAGPQYRPTGLPGSRTSNVGKYRPHSEEDEEEEEDFSNIERDYFESDQSYTQFYTPESQMIQDWSVNRAALDSQQPMSIQPLQQRMGIPAPGYFASALRGQALQYAQGAPSPGQMKATPGPGFFSVTPAPAIVAAPIGAVHLGVPVTPIPGIKPSDATSSPALMAALSNQRSITTGVSKAEPVTATSSATPLTPVNSEARVKSLFQARAFMEPKKIPGNITIYFDQHIVRATILMMNDTKEILFHHDINGLKVEPSFVPMCITWTGIKVGSQESEKVTVSLENAAVVTQLKDALQKAAILIQSKGSAPQAVTTTVSSIFGTPSLPVTTTGSQKTSDNSAKTNFGGFTFSTKPTVTPVQEDKEKPKAFTVKSSPAAPKDDAPKPFAGFSLTPSTAAAKPDLKFSLSPKPESTSLFSNKSPVAPTKSPGAVAKSPGGGDDDHVEEYEPNVDFKPVISLPELVEKKTGEENETEVFVERCKMFRFDIENKQWKERGVGELKILKSKDKVKFRIIMRRDQILKLCANHFITPDMQLTTMAASDKAWCYSAMDFSEEEMKLEKLAVRFKNAEKASAFQTVFEDCCKQLKLSESSAESKEVSKEKEPTQVAWVDSTDSGKSSKESNKPLSELFKPKAGSWECQGCYIRNNNDVLKCPACGTGKPGAQPANPPASTKPLNELFKPKAGSWECDGCLVRNGADVVKCPACGTLKPGAKADEVPSSTSRANNFASSITGGAAGTGFKFGSTTFGSATASSAASTTGGINVSVPVTTAAPTGFKLTTAGSSALSLGFKFGIASTTAAATTANTSMGGFKFSTVSTASTTLTTPTTAGFSFGPTSTVSSTTTASGGFKFGAPTTTTAALTTSPAPGEFKFVVPVMTAAASTTSTSGGFSFGASGKTASAATTTTSGGFSFGSPAVNTVASTPSTTPSVGGFKFGTPSTTTSTSGIPFKTDTSATPQQSGVKVTSTAAATTTSGFVFGTPKTTAFSAPTSNLFGISASTTTTSSTTTSFSFGQSPSKDGSKGPDTTGLLAKLLTSDDTPSTTVTKPSSGFNFTLASKTSTPLASGKPSSSSSTPGFQFSLIKSPVKPAQTSQGVPESPEVDEEGFYVNKDGDDSHIHFEPLVPLPEKVEVKTGEEDENILFESRGKMYRFVSGEWKEKGTGVLKILEHKITKKTRVLMRRDQVLKICCNHIIDTALSLQPMPKSDGKAWVWYALDFTEEGGQMEQLAVRFRTAEIASQFKEVFEKCRDNTSSSPAKPQSDQPSHISVKKELFKGDETSEDDVIIVGEDRPTQDQILKARKFLLPDTFYLYENRAPCPGCIGCNDGELPAVNTSAVHKSTKKEEPKSIVPQQPAFGVSGNLPDFSSLTSNSSSKKDSSFVFGSGTVVDFSSLASNSSNQGFSWQKAESSSPFKFAGAGQKLFGSGHSSSADADKGNEGEEGEDSAVAPSDDVHFEPVIPLPDLVEVKTGEEDWTPLFCQRAKLYKFDQALGQWKERGIGDIKILAHKTKSLYRILQRREQIFKVSCNHLISVDMELKPMATSETSWCWVANDYTEAEPSVEQFAVKFKNKEITAEFQNVFLQCQSKLRQSESAPQSKQETSEDAGNEEDEGGEDYEDEYDEEEEEKVLLEKRATLSSYENGYWKKLGTGTLFVKYNEDLGGNSVCFNSDSGENLCNHIICLEHSVGLDFKKHTCEWKPIDFSTDDPIRKHFCATFSSGLSAQEFAEVFNEGQRLAIDSEISEKVPSDIDVPEIFSGGSLHY